MTDRPSIDPLVDAATHALRAPSVFNSQPWRWRVGPGMLELRTERERHLAVTDPDGRMLTISCGAALHHARTALAAAGYATRTDRFPVGAGSDLIARVTVLGTQPADPRDLALAAAIPHRRTDRRAFGETPVPTETLEKLRAVVTAEETALHVVRPDQMPMLAVATARAAATELADPAYRGEVAHWTHRPAERGDGVPATAAVRQIPRRVPVRDYAPGGEPGLEAGTGNDRGAAYALLYGSGDSPMAWLRAGEALSALLLTAVVEGLSAAPLSDTIEVQWPRQLMRDLISGMGEPFLIVRLGIGAGADELPPVPRRSPADAIEITS